MRREVLLAIVFVPHDGRSARIVPEVHPASRHDVDVAVVVQIAGRCRGCSIESADRVKGKPEPARVLEPLQAVIRLRVRLRVERIAVRKKQVDIAVAIEIDRSQARRAIHRMWRPRDHAALEGPRTLVHERHDHLVLLRDERHQVHSAVAIQIGGRNVDCAAHIREQMLLVSRRRFFAARVFQPEHLPHIPASKHRDRDIQVAIRIEIECPSIAYAPEPLLQQLFLKRTLRSLPEEKELAGKRVERRKLPQVGNENVEVIVAVHIDDLRVNWDLDICQSLFRPRPFGLLQQEQLLRFSIGDEQLNALPCEARCIHVRHERKLRKRADRLRDEAARARTLIYIGQHRQLFRAAAVVERDDVVHLRFRDERATPALLRDRNHRLDHRRPAAFRQHIGARHGMARPAVLIDQRENFRGCLVWGGRVLRMGDRGSD